MRWLTIAVLVALAGAARAEDWPTYRHDAQRSGFTADKVAMPLVEHWVFASALAPSPAWSDPPAEAIEGSLERPRMRFDDAFHVAAAGGKVFFGSSSENKIYAIDAAGGNIVWQFYTDGPVRMAPTVAGGKLYAGSDDGYVYCLDAQSGKELWRFQAAPETQTVVGAGKVTSLWPVRTGVVVVGGAAYFGAGIFPAEGCFVYAVDANTGKQLWVNNSFTDGGQANRSPQGYLLASADRLVFPTGRTMPMVFDRAGGELQFQPVIWRVNGLAGGTNNVLDGGTVITAAEQIFAWNLANGKNAYGEGRQQRMPGEGSRPLAVGADRFFSLNGMEAFATDRARWTKAIGLPNTHDVYRQALDALPGQIEQARKAGKTADVAKFEKQQVEFKGVLEKLKTDFDQLTLWHFPCKADDAIIATPDWAFIADGDEVFAVGAADGKKAWSAKVHGRARGLAVAGGRLYVSTDKGSVHCFASAAAPQKAPAAQAPAKGGDASQQAVSQIVTDGAPTRGFALVAGVSADFAVALARASELTIYMIAVDEKSAADARAALTDAGLYGRVIVRVAAPAQVPMPDYFANLIVSDGAAIGPQEILRTLKPCGGRAYVAGGDALGQTKLKVEKVGLYERAIRGELPGAGAWSAQYGNMANTACSGDDLVRGPMSVLWFGPPGPAQVPNRHEFAASPLSVGGRLLVPGPDSLAAYDVYNGLFLWSRKLPDFPRHPLIDGIPGGYVADADNIFIAQGASCLRLDAATGKTLATFALPGGGEVPKGQAAPVWGYVGCSGGVLYGTRGSLREADLIFAYDVAGGKLLWQRSVVRANPDNVCIAEGKLFFVDRGVTAEQIAQATQDVTKAPAPDRRGDTSADVRRVVALDAATGKELWQSPQYLSETVSVGRHNVRGRPLGVFGTIVGGDLIVQASNGVVLLCGQPWNGHFWTQFVRGEFDRRSLIALSAADGKRLWSGRKGYRSRPLIVGDMVIAEPWAHDLKTGKQIMRKHPVTGVESPWQFCRPGHHCGAVSAANHMLTFRSGSIALYDLESDFGTAHFGGQRLACWINAVAAGGVLAIPEGSNGCACPYGVQTTVVFKPAASQRLWGIFSAAGAMTPVKHLAINFGAPGDRRDANGVLWLAYPRPTMTLIPRIDYSDSLILKFGLGVKLPRRGGGLFNESPQAWDDKGSGVSMICASGVQGVDSITLPLGGVQRAYTVRLYFAEPQDIAPGQRVIDVSLQGKKVLAALDIAKETGGRRKGLVKEFKGIQAGGELSIGLEATKGQPLLCGVEVVAE
ncbi:MAG: PQQ-binding-like beta-propeller repeat protein [Planctomycetaceae bacterium]|nr:PQQ-binding-like beta-propeller repeat protein [Planctomycetaceae bacterium]